LQEGGGAFVLVGSPAMREVARGDNELRPDALDQPLQRGLDRALLVGSDVEIGAG